MPENDLYMLQCPYCFEEFSHSKVHFRSETVYRDSASILEEVCTGKKYSSPDRLEEAAEEDDEYAKKCWQGYQKRLSYLAGKSLKYKEFWRPYSNRETPEIESNRLHVISPVNYDFDRPILGTSELVIKELKSWDGFTNEAIDEFGKSTTQRVCPYCNNPLPRDYGRYPVKHIAVLGVKSSGKTVYLSQLLNHLGEECNNLGITQDPLDPAMMKYIEDNSVEMGKKLSDPTEPTFLVQPLTVTLEIKGSKITFVFHDIAGESCTMGIDRIYARFVEHSDALIFIIDPKQLPSVFGMIDGERRDNMNLAIENIAHNYPMLRDKPTAVVLSQIDRKECVERLSDNPNTMEGIFYQANLTPVAANPLIASVDPCFCGRDYNMIFKKMKTLLLNDTLTILRNFRNFSYFAISAIGTDVQDGKPVATPTPYRIAEPFFWLLYKMSYIRSDVSVLELISREAFIKRVKEEAADLLIGDENHRWGRKVSVGEYGMVKKRNLTAFNNKVSELRAQFLFTDSEEG